MNLQKHRKQQLSLLTNEKGVYALCDLDCTPIYVGKSVDGIRSRVSRHLTSARSDVIANRQLDVWEIAYVWAWALPGASSTSIQQVEDFLIWRFNDDSPLVNGKIPNKPEVFPTLPEKQEIVVLPAAEIVKRKDPLLRLPRQITHFNNLFSHVLEVKDNRDLRRSLETHFSRLKDYYENFMIQAIQSQETEND